MNGLAVRGLRVTLVVILAGSLLAQAMVLPWLAYVMAQDYPEFAYLQGPMLLAAIVAVACCQVVLVCMWKLLAMVERDSIFSARAFVWLDRMIAAILLACAVVLVVLLSLAFFVENNQPGVMLALLLVVGLGLLVALLLTVMRGLLRQATILRADLAEVI